MLTKIPQQYFTTGGGGGPFLPWVQTRLKPAMHLIILRPLYVYFFVCFNSYFLLQKPISPNLNWCTKSTIIYVPTKPSYLSKCIKGCTKAVLFLYCQHAFFIFLGTARPQQLAGTTAPGKSNKQLKRDRPALTSVTVSLCMCMCMCAWERETERQRARQCVSQLNSNTSPLSFLMSDRTTLRRCWRPCSR